MDGNLDALTWEPSPISDDLNECCIDDGGERQHFETGAQREPCVGKGSFELISPFFLEELAIVLEKGAAKYDARNWEKGMPLSRYMNSALRHLNQELMGLTNENHMAQAAFNIMAYIHTRKMIQNFDDMPKYNQKRNMKMNQDVVDAAKLKEEVRKDTIESVISYLRYLECIESDVGEFSQNDKIDTATLEYIIGKLAQDECPF